MTSKGDQYDISENEKRLILERAKLREARKQEFMKKVTNPYRPEGGYIFDPAVQRYTSMQTAHYEYFKANLKTGRYFLGFVAFPIFGLAIYFHNSRAEYERKCRTGEVPYEQRKFKYH